MEYVFLVDGERHRVKVKKAGDGYVVKALDRAAEVCLRKRSDRSLVLETSGSLLEMGTAAEDGVRHVLVGGRTYRLERDRGGGERVRRAEETFRAGLYELKAPMPGRVVRIRARSGDYAARGTELVALEAMKMENLVTAPADVMVLDVYVRPGDLVEGGSALLSFEVF